MLMTRIRASAVTAGGMALLLACGAAAALPPAMDRVPVNAAMVMAVPSLARFEASASAVQKALKVPMDSGPFEELGKVMKLEGLNKAGSAAMAFLPGPDGHIDFDAAEPPMVMIVPVSDYAKFVGSLGGDAKGAVTQVKFEDSNSPAFAKNLGGGYAAIGPVKELVEGFEGKAGNAAAHTKALGPAGSAVADASDLVFVANLVALEPKLREGMEEMKGQMEMMGAMAGQEIGNGLAIVDAVMNGILRDGQAGVIGFNAKEAGFTFEAAAQFKEGSPSAALLSAKGAASGLLSRVPNQPYLFTVAMDMSAPGIKQIFRNMSAMTAKAGGEDASGMMAAMVKSIDSMDGMVFQWGNTPAMMGGGLFANAMAYVKTSNAAGYTGAMKDTFTALNGKTVSGMKYQASYKPGSKDVGGVKVDEWSMRMQADPNDPNAQQMQMIQMSMFGMEGGPSGFISPAEGGVIVTYSKNSALMQQGLDAAKGGAGLGADAGVKAVAAMLPADRSMEAYVGVKNILDMVLGFAAMMGGGGPNVQIPADLPPIGIGGTMNGGGVRLTTFMPAKVVETFRAMADEMRGEGMDHDAVPPPPPPGR
jgi:hypothetical protein